MLSKEDQTAPVSLGEIQSIVSEGDEAKKVSVVEQILNHLSEKRDAYNGIVSSIIYLIDSQDEIIIRALNHAILRFVITSPISYGGQIFLTKSLFRLIQERPTFVASLFSLAIVDFDRFKPEGINEKESLKIKIIALKAIRQSEEKARRKLTDLTDQEINLLCDDALEKCDDATKVDTLFLVFDTKFTTRIILDREIEIYKNVLRGALDFHEPSLRQIFLAITNKLIKRLNDGHRVVMREKQKFDDENRELITNRYLNFLDWLITFCFNNIHCNAYFGSFILTISTLRLIIEHITFNNPVLPIARHYLNPKYYKSVLDCLEDSFEENKSSALELLLMMPYDESFITEENLLDFERRAYKLVSSVNPSHSLTCQYVFKLLIGLRCRQLEHIGELDSLARNRLVYEHLCRLVDQVQDGVNQTEVNFILALKDNPIYPKLTCIKALLNEVDVSKLQQQREEWESLTSKIINTSIDACRAVSAVVCNLNPETIGHLPMDMEPLDIHTLSESLNVSLNISDDELQTITSQILLISAWRTIKECSLSMGHLCERFWWPSERIKEKLEKFPGFNYPPIVQHGDIKRIIDFFDHYLRNLRHRGAFEQAYTGFFMVTKRVWHEPEHRDLLICTLNDIMNDFRSQSFAIDSKKVEHLKAYVTRRSAGLPFIVQAIVNSEHRHESKTLRWVMDTLFEVLEDPNTETYQRIHCLNILKALTKEHHLGEKVTPYTGKTFEVTMDAFKSDSFPIRNCANMLLKAILDRTFGVNRLRDDIHKRNKLSFEKFFSECKKLHEKMLGYLQDGLDDKKYLASVHLVFIVLSHLKPSLNPSEDYTTEKMIRPFVKPIMELSVSCPDFRLRELAARLAIRLELYCFNKAPNDEEYDKILENIEHLFYENGLLRGDHCNRLHGGLNLIKSWIESKKFPDNSMTIKHRVKLDSLAQRVAMSILNHDCKNEFEDFSWTSLRCTVMDLIIEDRSTRDNDEFKRQWSSILSIALKYQPSGDIGLKAPHHEQYSAKLRGLLANFNL